MNYYYDIVLNFLENRYQFYDCLENDNYEYIKKIPLIQVTTVTFKKIICNEIKVDKSFLNKIRNETLTKTQKIEYACLIADKNNVIGLEFNNEGLIIAFSPLKIEDELNVLDIIYTVELEQLEFECLNSKKINPSLRKEENIKKLIKLELERLYVDKNYSKLQFLYLEWFNKLEKDMNIMYRRMMERIEKDVSSKEEAIYNLIKLSYNNV